jgi:hypothetical protein
MKGRPISLPLRPTFFKATGDQHYADVAKALGTVFRSKLVLDAQHDCLDLG